MGWEKFGMFILLLSVQLHLLIALPQTSLPNPFMTIDSKQEQNVTYKGVPENLSMSAKLSNKQNIRAVNKRGGGGHGGGGHRGGRGHAGIGRAPGGEKRSPLQGGAVFPRHVPGGTSHSYSHGSDSDILNNISLPNLILAVFASFFLI